MKKKVLLLALMVSFTAIVTTGTLAYFTTESRVHNVITSHSVDVEIEYWQETRNGPVPYQAASVAVMPGITVSRIATIKSLEADCYIRAKYAVVIKDSTGTILNLSQNTLDSIISVAMNREDWSQKTHDCDWWYYSESVCAGDSTKPLFTAVSFDGFHMTNEYQNCTVEVIVEAQAVQSANNKVGAVEAVGWPEN